MIENSEYYVKEYIQKSKALLLPLISNVNFKGLITTYLFAEEITDKDILNYFLFCETQKETELSENLSKYLVESYDTENNTELHIFNMEDFKDDIEKFLSGSYSEFKIESKELILKNYNWIKSDNKVVTPEEIKKYNEKNYKLYNKYIYVILYPDLFKKEFTENAVDFLKLFENKEEALKVFSTMKELFPLYDLEKETYSKNLKNKK